MGRHLDVDIPTSELSQTRFFSYHELYLVQIRLPLPTPPDFNQSGSLQLFHKFVDPRTAHGHVFGKAILPRKTLVIVPSIVQKHRIGYLRTWTKRVVFKNEVRKLCKSA